ncbi:transposase, partial [Microbulbifer sp. 2205BS26-8]|uniref:transposase n=1 Tax=Microbulbifer sp. 2205BS26-8 TaxID=3064386 RepID=UPI00273FE40D
LRTSRWTCSPVAPPAWPNQWRLLLLAQAWVLYEYLREQLQDTKLGKASVATLRNRLIKVGAVMIKNTRRFRFLLPTLLPDREILLQAGYPFGADVES